MSQYIEIHPDNPQARLIKQAVDIITAGGVIIYPTDSSYAIGCHCGKIGTEYGITNGMPIHLATHLIIG